MQVPPQLSHIPHLCSSALNINSHNPLCKNNILYFKEMRLHPGGNLMLGLTLSEAPGQCQLVIVIYEPVTFKTIEKVLFLFNHRK